MFNTICRKSWVSPLTAFSFIAVAGTGTLMLLGVHLPAIKGIHEWIGLLFLLAGVLHVVLNWRTLLGHLSSPTALAALALVVALGLALSFVGGSGPGHRFGPGMGPDGEQFFGENSAADTSAIDMSLRIE